MGICAAPEKKPKLFIEISAKNEEKERVLAEKLKEILVAKGCQIECNPIIVNKERLFMKITYRKGNESEMSLTSGNKQVDEQNLMEIASEICNKCKENN